MNRTFFPLRLPLFLILIWHGNQPAWSNNAQHQVDSLQALLHRTTVDSTRVRLLCALAEGYQPLDADRALKAARDAYALALRIDFGAGASQALHALSIAFDGLGEVDSSIHYCGLGISYDKRANDEAALARSYNSQGCNYLNKGDLKEAEKYLLLAQNLSIRMRDTSGLSDVFTNLAMLEARRGDVAKTLKYDILSLRIAEQQNYRAGIGRIYNHLALDYTDLKVYDEALSYAERSVAMCLELGNLPDAAAAHLTRGTIHFKQGNKERSAEAINAAIALIMQHGDKNFLTEAYNNMATLRASFGEYAEADQWLQRSLANTQEMNDTYGTMYVLHELGANAMAQEDHARALAHYEKALPIAKDLQALEDLETIYTGLQQAYAGLGQYEQVYRYTQLYNAVHDTLVEGASRKELSTIRTEFETEKKEHEIAVLSKDNEIQTKEVGRQRLLRNSVAGGLFGALLFMGVVLQQKRRITKEKARSEELLLNILPEEVAEELKNTGGAVAKHFDSATILFTDFKGFTEASEKLTPQELVEELNICFKAFDHIGTAHHIEKIKTIGDAYMCAGGLPDPTSGSPLDVVLAALEMQDFMHQRKVEREAQGKPYFEMRVGVHTGPVVAGIVGVKKFQYDIWGDTVNTASRMESSGEVGQVNISEATYALVKHEPRLSFVPRGKVKAKGKGEMEMFFVERSGEAG